VPASFQIMGVLNVTPDSFSDGGRYTEAQTAVAHGLAMEDQGADIIDVGGESTRPGAEPVDAEHELTRTAPVVEGLIAAGLRAQISIDTSKRAVAEAALDAGAAYVNDVTALRADPELAGLVAQRGVDCCLMHMRGEPRTMQEAPHYDDVVDDVRAFLTERVQFAVSEGIAPERIMIDPGIGFGKTTAHNLELLARLPELAELGRPIVIGTSRKAFLGRLAGGAGPQERLPGTIATNLLAWLGGASVLRVHDVAAVRAALEVASATVSARWPQPTHPTTRTS